MGQATLRIVDGELVWLRNAVYDRRGFHVHAHRDSIVSVPVLQQRPLTNDSSVCAADGTNCVSKAAIIACTYYSGYYSRLRSLEVDPSRAPPRPKSWPGCPRVFGVRKTHKSPTTLYVSHGLLMQEPSEGGKLPIIPIHLLPLSDSELGECKHGKVAARDVFILASRRDCPTLSGGSFWEWWNEIWLPGYHMTQHTWPRLGALNLTQSAPLALYDLSVGTRAGGGNCAKPLQQTGELPSGWGVRLWGGAGLRMLPLTGCTRFQNLVVGLSKSTNLYLAHAGGGALAAELRGVQALLVREGHGDWARPSHSARAPPAGQTGRAGTASARRTMVWLKRGRRRFLANESALFAAAHSLKLDVVWPSSQSLAERFHLFRDADIIFLPHGADGASLVLMQPCTVVVQLCPCGYSELATGCDHHYFGGVATLMGGIYLGGHLKDDMDGASRRGCKHARTVGFGAADMWASQAYLEQLLERARREAERLDASTCWARRLWLHDVSDTSLHIPTGLPPLI